MLNRIPGVENTEMILNIVICYKNENEVLSYAKKLSLLEHSDEIALAVVCNKVGKNGIDYLAEELPKTGIKNYIFLPDENLGYLNGMVYGFRCLAELNVVSDWYIFSNTDIDFPQSDVITRFLGSEEFKNSDYWLVGPSIFVPNKKIHSNPYKLDRPSKLSYARTNFGLLFPRLFDFLYHDLKRTKENPHFERSAKAYAIHGSFMLLRKELLQELTNRPAWELLYDEEPYLGEIARENKKHVFYDSSMLVHHLEGACTGKTDLRWKYKIMRNSNKRILREFY